MANGDVWAAEREGLDAGQAATQYGLLNRANNALVAQYGPQAGNPEAMASLENTNYLSQLHPELVQAQGIANTTNQVGANIAVGTQGSTIASTNATNAGNEQIVPYKVQDAKAAAANNTAIAQQGTVGANAALAAQHGHAVLAATNAMQTYLAANPGDTEGAYKAGVAAANMVAPGEGDAYNIGTPQGDALHAQFTKDPSGTVNGLREQVNAGMQAQYQLMTPEQRAIFNKNNLDAQKVSSDILTARQAQSQAANDNVNKILASSGPIGAGLAQTQGALDNIAKMRALVSDMSNSSFLQDALMKHVPGSDMQQLQALAESVRSALSVDMLQGAKQAGASLGVRASNTEFNAIGDAVAKIDPSMSLAQLKDQIDNAEKAVHAYRDGATALLQGPNGPAEYRQALARKRQADLDLNQAQGIYLPADASTAPAASPAAPASPTGAAGQGAINEGAPKSSAEANADPRFSLDPKVQAQGQPVARVGGPTVQQQNAPQIGSFDAALAHTFGAEGGYNPSDANGAPVNMGINAAAHPGEDVKGMTRERATQIYKTQYWDAIGGDELAKTNPGLAHAGFDIAVVDGADKAKQLIAQAGNDPNKLVDLQQQFQNNLIAQDPSRYGKYADVWARRNQALKSDIAGGVVGSSYAGAGAGPPALTPGQASGWQPVTSITPNAPPTQAANVAAPAAAPAAPAQQQQQPAGPVAQGGGVGRGAAAVADSDPLNGSVAHAFKGERSQVMAGRALLAKYLGKVVNA